MDCSRFSEVFLVEEDPNNGRFSDVLLIEEPIGEEYSSEIHSVSLSDSKNDSQDLISDQNLYFNNINGQLICLNIASLNETTPSEPVILQTSADIPGPNMVLHHIPTTTAGFISESGEPQTQVIVINDKDFFLNSDSIFIENLEEPENDESAENNFDSTFIHAGDNTMSFILNNDVSFEENEPVNISNVAENNTSVERVQNNLNAVKSSKNPSSDAFLDINIDSGKPIYSCRLCQTEFLTWKAYRIHFTEHLNHKYYKCDHCSESFNKEINYTLHLSIHEVKNGFKCPSCQKMFNRLASLKSHIKLHEIDETLQCRICHEEFTSMVCYEFHMKEHNVVKVIKVENLSTEQSWICSFCSKSCPDKVSYEKHVRGHFITELNEAAPVVQKKKLGRPKSTNNRCTICNKCFLKPSQLERHAIIHTGERPYKCDICNSSFNQKWSLQTHMTKHSDNKPYICKICKASFHQKGNLRSHVLRVHALPKLEHNIYRCLECPCIFRKINSLNKHNMRSHQHVVSRTHEKNKSNLEDDDNRIETRVIEIAVKISDGYVSYQKVYIVVKDNKTRFECSHCSRMSSRIPEIIRHLKSHILGEQRCKFQQYICNYCTEVFCSEENFIEHLLTHTKRKVPISAVQLSTQSGLENIRSTSNENGSETGGKTNNRFQENIGNSQNGDGTSQIIEIGNDCDQSNKREISYRIFSEDDSDPDDVEPISQLKNKNCQHDISPTLSDPGRNSTDAKTLQEVGGGLVEEEEEIRLLHRTQYRHNFKCNECGNKYTRKYDLKRHCLSHLKYKSYICYICKKSYIRLGTCKLHMRLKHNVNYSQEVEVYGTKNQKTGKVEYHNTDDKISNKNCDKNDKENQIENSESSEKNSSVELLDTLNANNCTIDKYKCGNCDNIFESQESLDEHQTLPCTFLPESEHLCKTCKLTFTSQKSYNVHIQIHKKKISKCLYCNLELYTQYALHNHLVQHAVKNQFPCIHCGSVYGSESNMKMHIMNRHLTAAANLGKGRLTVLTAKEQKKIANQKMNNNASVSQKILKRILKSRITEEPTSSKQQNEISKIITRSSTVKKPACKKRKRKKNRKILEQCCSYCSKSFKKNCDLVRHIRRHTGEKPFKCEYCDKCFTLGSILNNHMKTHMKLKDIACHVCGKFFSATGALKIHLLLHTGDKPYGCKLCSEKFQNICVRNTHESKCGIAKKSNTIIGEGDDMYNLSKQNDKEDTGTIFLDNNSLIEANTDCEKINEECRLEEFEGILTSNPMLNATLISSDDKSIYDYSNDMECQQDDPTIIYGHPIDKSSEDTLIYEYLKNARSSPDSILNNGKSSLEKSIFESPEPDETSIFETSEHDETSIFETPEHDERLIFESSESDVKSIYDYSEKFLLVRERISEFGVVNLFECGICNMQFKCKQSYLYHTRLFIFDCIYCGTHFASDEDLKTHQYDSHCIEQDGNSMSASDCVGNGNDKNDEHYDIDIDSVISDLFMPGAGE